MIKTPPANAGDLGSIPGLGRSPEGGHGNPLLENPMDRGACWATVHMVAQSQTQLKQLSKHTPGMVKYKIHNKFKGKGRTSF